MSVIMIFQTETIPKSVPMAVLARAVWHTTFYGQSGDRAIRTMMQVLIRKGSVSCICSLSSCRHASQQETCSKASVLETNA